MRVDCVSCARIRGEVMLYNDVLEMAIETYGEQMQMDIVIEEASELIKSKRRAWRNGGNYELDRRVFEEMIDLRVTLDQMEQIFISKIGRGEYNKQYNEQRGKVAQELLFRIRRDKAQQS